jgi:hypothetical protein
LCVFWYWSTLAIFMGSRYLYYITTTPTLLLLSHNYLLQFF